jgi:hypothetical protein
MQEGNGMSKRWLMWLGCGLMVVAGLYFLWSRGYQNILGYAMLLLCPLMHLFMHRGHNHGSDHEHTNTNPTNGNDQEPKKPACH